ncbi:MAG: AAA family ATPase [Theionarchaea archaeon]|nr:AAA family ATPase [Theionarchaea archaeon]
MNPFVNPFIPGGIVPLEKIIVDRKRASNVFSPLIYEGGSVGVYGDRGLGKSSLLCYIAYPQTDWWEKYFQNHIFVAFNCQDTVIPFTPANFWCQAVWHLNRKVKAGPLKEKCQALLTQEEGSELNQHDFHDILDTAAKDKKRIVLVLDDFDYLIRTDSEHLESTRAFLQGLRSLITRYSNKANLVVATRRSLEELCKPVTNLSTSPFSNGFTCYRLQLFREAEIHQLVHWIEEIDQPRFSDDEVKYICHLSGHHPQLAQIAASEVFDQRSETGAPLDDLTPVGERFKSKARHVFESLWAAARDVERMLLMFVALQEQNGKIPQCHYDLGDLPVIFSQRERELIELADRGLIRKRKDTFIWEIFSPIFDWWILKEIESADPERLDECRKVWGSLLTQKQAKRLGHLVDAARENKEFIRKFAQIVIQMAGWTLPIFG